MLSDLKVESMSSAAIGVGMFFAMSSASVGDNTGASISIAAGQRIFSKSQNGMLPFNFWLSIAVGAGRDSARKSKAARSRQHSAEFMNCH